MCCVDGDALRRIGASLDHPERHHRVQMSHLRTLMSCDRTSTPRTSGDLASCPSRARSLGDSRGTTDTNGQNLADSALEHFPAHRPLWAAPLQGGTLTPSTKLEQLGIGSRYVPYSAVKRWAAARSPENY
jgi:hypothetical protein